MFNIIIPFDESQPDGPPFDSPNYRNGYKELSEKAQNYNLKVYFSRGIDSYAGKGVFKNCYYLNNDKLDLAGQIKADAVFDKSKYLEPDGTYLCVNHEQIKNICNDKLLTYEYFKDISPHTQKINSKIELDEKLLELKGLVVIKPIDGSAGKGVVIKEAEKINTNEINVYPVILQKFIDSSRGIPGLIKGYHDLRVAVVDGRIIYSFIRTPGDGDYRAGIATGGKLTVIANDKIPSELKKIVLKIDEVFKKYGHRLYTVDVAYDGDKYLLIELNSQPGMTSEEIYPDYSSVYQNEILKLLQTMILNEHSGINH